MNKLNTGVRNGPFKNYQMRELNQAAKEYNKNIHRQLKRLVEEQSEALDTENYDFAQEIEDDINFLSEKLIS